MKKYLLPPNVCGFMGPHMSICKNSTTFKALWAEEGNEALECLAKMQCAQMTDQIDMVVNCTPIRVKIKSKLINLIKITRTKGCNDKCGSNPQGIREISDDLFEFGQIGRWIDDRNSGKWYFMKEDLKTIPWNPTLSNLTLISQRNWRSKMGEISET